MTFGGTEPALELVWLVFGSLLSFSASGSVYATCPEIRGRSGGVMTLCKVTSSGNVDKGDSSLDSGSGEAESVLIFLFGGSIVVDVDLVLEGGRSLVSGDRQSCDAAYTHTQRSC